MRAVIQRVTRASVRVENDVVGAIGSGLLILLGIATGDDATAADRLARKCAELRVFADEDGRFARSLIEVGGEALVISQFTLFGDARRGRRPSFTAAAPPAVAAPLVAGFIDTLRALDVRVETGRFGASMLVESTNDGPVTIIIDSSELQRPLTRKPGR